MDGSQPGCFWPPGDICHRLLTFLVGTAGRGCYWHLVVEARVAAQRPSVGRVAEKPWFTFTPPKSQV